ncbi:MAG: PAS domain-containing protein [Eubacteriales bacterium]
MVDKLKPYMKMVDFLSNIFGSNTEIVLHDLSDYKKSIISIKNGHISGRKEGDSITDLLLKMIIDGEFKSRKYLSNYKVYSANGDVLRASTMIIEDEEGEPIGALCINTNVSMLNHIKAFVDEHLSFSEEKIGDESVQERLDGSVDEYCTYQIKRAVEKVGIHPSRMSVEEKTAVVKSLQKKGIFLLKGTVAQTAQELGISEPSVYRYMKK